jgi:hypothetical protein
MSSRALTAQMPEISRFYGLVIKIFYDDHNPPHFTRSIASTHF